MKLLRLFGSFGPFRAAKFWAAALIGLAAYLRVYTGFDLGIDEETAIAIAHGAVALVVWLVPNKISTPKFKLPDKVTGLW